MAARQALIKPIEWVKIFERTAPELKSKMASFKSKSDAILTNYIKAQSSGAAAIDWAHYRANVANRQLVDEFEAKYNALEVPRPVDTKSAALAAKALEDAENFKQFVVKVADDSKGINAEVERICSLPPFEQMTFDDICENFPRLRPDYEKNPSWPHLAGPHEVLTRKR